MPDTHTADQNAPDLDVLVVGAGISGIGAAWHLSTQCPGNRFLVLEALESYGGTWLVHRYPGIRSDSDLYTFGYRFKPWTGHPIATAEEIQRYLGETIAENGLDAYIRYRHRIVAADWSSANKRWTVQVERTDTGERFALTAGFLWMCQGYYHHAEGYTPEWPGMQDFRGRIVHPQTWPEDLDYTGKRVIVIGSGATAATVVPAMAGRAAHIVLLQRSPTYFVPGRNENDLANELRRLQVDEAWIHEIVRRKVLLDQHEFTQRAVAEPEAVKEELLAGVQAFLGPGADMQKHFTPRYRPWQQRLAFVPDGDLFQAVARGEVSVETDHIERFTERGILLRSGKELEADIIVTATGFRLSVLGDIPFAKDGVPIDWSKTVTWRGMMFSDVPNLLWVFGYFRASWTLRVDLLGDFTCRLLQHMDARGAREVVVRPGPEDAGMPLHPWVDPDDFNPGYLMRDAAQMPQRGSRPKWAHTQDYWREKEEIPAIDLEDREFSYG
jgi:cation diffusion facilitator CzcD-associated flavoprotein CzcO